MNTILRSYGHGVQKHHPHPLVTQWPVTLHFSVLTNVRLRDRRGYQPGHYIEALCPAAVLENLKKPQFAAVNSQPSSRQKNLIKPVIGAAANAPVRSEVRTQSDAGIPILDWHQTPTAGAGQTARR